MQVWSFRIFWKQGNGRFVLFFLDHHLLKTPYLIKEKPSVLITTYPCIVVSKFSAIVDTTTSIWVSLRKTI